jgi:adenylate kinase
MRMILLGPPGAGKGTQAERISERYNLKHISTGDIFRGMDKESELGQKVHGYMQRGELVPDDLVIQVVMDALKSAGDNWMLDGFPRTLPQAEALDKALEEAGTPLDLVLHFEVDDEEIVRRLSGRRIAPKSGRIYHVEYSPPKQDGICDVSGEELIQRDDDQPEAIRERLKTYHAQTAPLIPYYKERGVLKTVDGTGKTPDEVSAEVWEVMGAQSTT